jgi:D-glycero-alpha-D-manno-heptose-7-phosphate kinase
MIISKTPFRVSFFGGGTDYPDYFHEFGGSVISTSINHYMYITVKPILGVSDYNYRLAYSKLEICDTVDEIQHPVVRAALKLLNITHGLEINIISDLPAKTGIGSSSSFTVGLLNALHTMQGVTKSKHELALQAIQIEQVILNERVGVQDQLAAAHGGLNHMLFTKDALQVIPQNFNPRRIMALQSNLLMFYTGISRFASDILEEQVKNTSEKKVNVELKHINDMVNKGIAILNDDASDLDTFGTMLHEAWMTKKKLSSAISNGHLDDIYDRAMAAGALGGKLLGAGGGGFFIFYVPFEKQAAVQKALHDLKEVIFEFEDEGTSIVYKS